MKVACHINKHFRDAKYDNVASDAMLFITDTGDVFSCEKDKFKFIETQGTKEEPFSEADFLNVCKVASAVFDLKEFEATSSSAKMQCLLVEYENTLNEALSRLPRFNIKRLSDQLHIDKVYVRQVVFDFVDRGLVELCASYYKVTEKGKLYFMNFVVLRNSNAK